MNAARPATRATLLVVAHPDDETLGAGGRLADIDPVAIAIATDGAPRDPWFARAAGCAGRAAYAQMRRQELEAAMTAGGLPLERLRVWSFVDQEAVRHLRELVEVVRALLLELRPEAVLTHPYEGGHPDHDAVAFAVHAAVASLRARARPELLEMAFYHQGRDDEVLGAFAGDTGRAIVLEGPALARKRAMIACYRSQERVLSRFPLAVEHVRPAPFYDFTAMPPTGRFQYDAFGWAVRGSDFLAATSAASSVSPGAR